MGNGLNKPGENFIGTRVAADTLNGERGGGRSRRRRSGRDAAG